MTPPRSSMIGRRAELDRLVAAWHDAQAAEPQWRFVAGEAGMGKTTLVGALQARVAETGLAVTGQCIPHAGDGLPLVPVAQALRRIVDAHGRAKVLDWAGAGRSSLGALVPELGQPGQGDDQRLRLFEAVARVVEGAARTQPLLLVVEDLHWADATTRELLRFLRAAVTGAPLLVVGTFRSDEITRNHPLRPWLADIVRTPGTARIDLQPLDDADARALVGSLADPDVDPAHVDDILARAEGVPYFLEELVCADASDCELPWTLRDALLVRVQALPDSTQDVLRLASMAGNRVDHALLAAVHRDSEAGLDADLRRASEAHLLVPETAGYAFRHALLREAIHDDVLPGEHVRLHARYADAVESDPHLGGPAVLVHHLFASGQLDRAFRAAIDLARDESLPKLEAIALFERVLEIWDRVPEATAYAGPHHRVLLEVADAASWAGLASRTLRLVEAALAEMPDDEEPEFRVRGLVMKARAVSNLMRRGALEILTEAEAQLPDGHSELRAIVLAELTSQHMLASRYEEALALSSVALDELDHLPPSPARDELRARGLNTRATVCNSLGDREALDTLMAESRALIQHRPHALLRYSINYSDGLFLAGLFRRSADVALEGMQAAADIGLARPLGSMLAGNAAAPLIYLGEIPRARELVDRALALRPPEKHRLQLETLLAQLLVWEGDLDGAGRLLAQFDGPRGDRVRSFPQYAVEFALVQAAVAVERGDHARVDGAVDIIRTIGSGSRGTSAWTVVALGARSLRERGLDVRAGLTGLGDLPRLRTTPAWEALVEAEAADSPEAWHAAVDHPLGVDRGVHTQAYAQLQLARALAAAGDADGARETWERGRAEARRIGHRPLAALADALATRAGLAATGAATILTPREAQVLALVAEGLSNGEIAARLVISTKTASVHVSNIMNKLGATSRTQAATIAHRRGLV